MASSGRISNTLSWMRGQRLLNGSRIEGAHPGDGRPQIGDLPRPGASFP
jgi:hypothetical protein